MFTVFTRQRRNSSFQELYEVKSGDTPAVAVFRTKKKAVAYGEAILGEGNWEMFTVPKSHLFDLIDGYAHVVLDPPPDGLKPETIILTRFAALVELDCR